MNTRGQRAMQLAPQWLGYLAQLTTSAMLPGSWGARLFELRDRGEISPQQALSHLFDYIAPSLDTTINATSATLWLFARNPQQWQMLREDPSLIPGAINETLRLESPIRAFSRYVTEDVEIGGLRLHAGQRALMVFGAANRDARRWQDPERFDIRRKATDHLAFGHGVHACIGMHLARLEMTCLLEVLAKRIARFELLDARFGMNNVLRGLESLHIALH